MIERIKRFIELQNETSSSFANEIGVQRSSVSHVLSGRNKPSLDFVIKIKERYPDVSLEWLIYGKGGIFYKKEEKETTNKTISNEISSDQKNIDFDQTSVQNTKEVKVEDEIIVKDELNIPYGLSNKKNIKKIILLYQDNSFEEFNPSN